VLWVLISVIVDIHTQSIVSIHGTIPTRIIVETELK